MLSTNFAEKNWLFVVIFLLNAELRCMASGGYVYLNQ